MRIPRVIAAGMAGVATISFFGASPAHAVTSQWNNVLPYGTECFDSAYTVHSMNFRSGVISMKYSPRCDTNWVEWRGPANVRVVKTMVEPFKTIAEADYTSWSYSRMVYAPGTTRATGRVIVESEEALISCAQVCSHSS